MGLPNIITKINSLETKHTALETKHNNFETKYNSEVVKLSGNQTVGGTKTFTAVPYVKGSGPAYSLQNTDVTKGTVPTANKVFAINCLDSAGTATKNRLGLFQSYYNTAGNVITGMYAYKPVADSTTSTGLQIIYPASGNPYGTAPTPDATANGTHIATTAWVRGKGVLIESYISGTTWYRKYSDGWIEQGGRVTTTATSGTVTFYKAFSNTNYGIFCQEGEKPTAETAGTDTSGYAENIGLTNYTTTTVRYSCVSNRYFNWFACGK